MKKLLLITTLLFAICLNAQDSNTFVSPTYGFKITKLDNWKYYNSNKSKKYLYSENSHFYYIIPNVKDDKNISIIIDLYDENMGKFVNEEKILDYLISSLKVKVEIVEDGKKEIKIVNKIKIYCYSVIMKYDTHTNIIQYFLICVFKIKENYFMMGIFCDKNKLKDYKPQFEKIINSIEEVKDYD